MRSTESFRMLLWDETETVCDDPLGGTLKGKGRGRSGLTLFFCILLSPLLLLSCLQIPFSFTIRGTCRRKRKQKECRKERERKGGKEEAHGRRFQNLTIDMKKSVFFPDWLLCTDVPLVVWLRCPP